MIPNAVAPSFFATQRLPAQPPFVLYVGALEEKKGVRQLLEGFARLRADQPGLKHRLLLAGGVGGGAFDLAAALDSLSPETLARVHVLGRVSEERLRELYRAAELSCYLSRYEGFGLPPLEAMAAGTPTLVADAAVPLPSVRDSRNRLPVDFLRDSRNRLPVDFRMCHYRR